jgi:hypothetical protein
MSSLRISPASTENGFWLQSSHRLAVLDFLVCQYCVSQGMCLILGRSGGAEQPTTSSHLLVLFAAFLLHGALILFGKAFYCRHRTAIVWAVSLLRAVWLVFLHSIPAPESNWGTVSSPMVILVAGGIHQLMVLALGNIQTFPTFLFAQAACAIATSLSCTARAVSFLSTPPHRQLSLKLYNVLDSTFMLTSGSIQPLTERPCQLHTAQLHTLVLFLQLYLGLLLPSYVMYCWELNAKMAMLTNCSTYQDESTATALHTKLSSPAALLVAERSWRAAATHVLLHLVLIMPLCWSAAALAPHIWLLGAGGYDVATVTVC